MTLHRLMLFALLAILPECALATPLYSRMVIFGDSYLDQGNATQQAGYYMNRASNGPVWVEDLAPKIGLPSPVRSSAGGTNATNFAYSGAAATGTYIESAPDLAAQVTAYLRRGAPAGDELVVIGMGINDMQFGPGDPSLASRAIRTQVTRLAGLGAKSFLVVNAPPIGSLPFYRGTPEITRLNDLAGRFNVALANDVAGLRTTLGGGVDVRLFDLHEVFAEALARPQDFGFTNVTSGAFNVGARDPDKYLFWDGFHPTRVFHADLADRAKLVLDAAPEPSAAAMLGLCGLTALRRRRASTARKQRPVQPPPMSSLDRTHPLTSSVKRSTI
jgi:thermolabile hemolysin